MYFVHCLLLRTPETVQRVECKKRFPHSFVFTCFFPHVLVHAFFCLKWIALSPMRWCRDACMYLSRRLLSSLYTEWSSSYSLFTTWWCSAFDCCCCCSCCVCLFWLSARARCDHKRKNWMESAYIMSTCSFLDSAFSSLRCLSLCAYDFVSPFQATQPTNDFPFRCISSSSLHVLFSQRCSCWL